MNAIQARRIDAFEDEMTAEQERVYSEAQVQLAMWYAEWDERLPKWPPTWKPDDFDPNKVPLGI